MSSAGACLAHTVVCTKQGQVFMFGGGTYGRLGHGDLRTEEFEEDNVMVCSVPRLVDELVGMQVVYVAKRAAYNE